MRYNGIFGILFIIILFIMFLNSALSIIILCNANNEDIRIELKIRYFFNIIKINFQLYPIENDKKKKVKTNLNKMEDKGKKPSINDILEIYYSIKKLLIKEIYSDIKFGSTNIHFTCFIQLFINIIYGNVINLFKSEKMYLKVTPNFIQNFLQASIKIHINAKIKNLLEIGFKALKVYIKIKKSIKEDNKNERTWFNKKSYGNNS